MIATSSVSDALPDGGIVVSMRIQILRLIPCLLLVTLVSVGCGTSETDQGKYHDIAGEWVVDMSKVKSSLREHLIPKDVMTQMGKDRKQGILSLLGSFLVTIKSDGSYEMLGLWRLPHSLDVSAILGHFEKSERHYRVYDTRGRYTPTRTLRQIDDGLVLQFHDQQAWLKALYLVRKPTK